MNKTVRIVLAVISLLSVVAFLAASKWAPPTSNAIQWSLLCFFFSTATLISRNWGCLYLVAGLVVLTVILVGSQALFGNALVGIIFLIGGVLLVGLCWFGYRRWKYRAWRKAVKLHDAGDILAAVSLMRKHLEWNDPSAECFHFLGILYGSAEFWEDALEHVEYAIELGGPEPHMLSTKGFFLWQLGRIEEARACLAESVLKLPSDFTIVCSYGHFLAVTGTLPEAEQELKRAEELYAKLHVFGAANRRYHAQLLEQLRQKIVEVRSSP